MSNMAIRLEMAKHGLKQWQVAELLGISEQAFSKKLRKELSTNEQDKIIQLIESRTVV